MSDTAIGIAGRWFRERRELARARSSAEQPGKPESVEQHAWRGLDTTTRDLAVEASVLGQLADVLRTSTEAGLRAGRYGDRDRIEGTYSIGEAMWSSLPDEGRVGGLESTIDRLLAQALERGIDLSDLTITVRPGDGDVLVRLEGVRR